MIYVGIVSIDQFADLTAPCQLFVEVVDIFSI